VGLQPQIAEIGNFWYKFDQKGYTPLSDFTKFGLGEGFQVCTLKSNFTAVTKATKIGNFLVYICPKGYIHFSNFFYKIWHGSNSHVPTITLTFAFMALKMWPYGRQNRQK